MPKVSMHELLWASDGSASIIDCRDTGFIEVQLHFFWSAVHVVPGSSATMYKCNGCHALRLCGASDDLSDDFDKNSRQTCGICKKEGGLVVTTDFDNHGQAYEDILRMPEGTTVLLPGLLLVRQGGGWVHMVNSAMESDGQDLQRHVLFPDTETYLEGSVPETGDYTSPFFYQILDTEHLLHLGYLDQGKLFQDILFPLAQLLHKILSLDRYGSVENPQGKLLEWFRQYEQLESSSQEYRHLQEENHAFTEAIRLVVEKVNQTTTEPGLRKLLADAHPVFQDEAAC
jgi:hypothetical protein